MLDIELFDGMRRARKHLRLPEKTYCGRGWCFVTACCEQRRRLFADPLAANWLLSELRELARAHHFAVHAFCIMPDHIHLLVQGCEDSSNLIVFLGRFKQRTGYEGWLRFGHRLWQKNFYDHVLRASESADAVAWYIWMNPVRAGLCKVPEDYQFSGSFTVDWKRVTRPARPWQPP